MMTCFKKIFVYLIPLILLITTDANAKRSIERWLPTKGSLAKLGVSSLLICQLGVGFSGCAIFREGDMVKKDREINTKNIRSTELKRPALTYGSHRLNYVFYPQRKILSNQECVTRYCVGGFAFNTGQPELTIPYNSSTFLANRVLMRQSDYHSLFVNASNSDGISFGIVEYNPVFEDNPENLLIHLLDGEQIFSSSRDIQGFYLGRDKNHNMREAPLNKASFLPLSDDDISYVNVEYGNGTLYGKTVELFTNEIDILHVSWFIPEDTDTIIEVRPPELYAVKRGDWIFTHENQDTGDWIFTHENQDTEDQSANNN